MSNNRRIGEALAMVREAMSLLGSGWGHIHYRLDQVADSLMYTLDAIGDDPSIAGKHERHGPPWGRHSSIGVRS